MPIFYRKAIEAAIYPTQPDWLNDSHLADWNGLADAMNRLTPEQRCDAIYIDWLLRLNDNRTLILPIRDYLIGQGALSANYLAELAQNADDASDGQEAEIRIIPNGEYLFVCNNGRKITSLNLLGLSRFFVHSAGKVVELNDKTIGRFGIGFKSCYRIASEVFVFTKDVAGEYGFRLPVCREGDNDSQWDANKLTSLLNRLEQVGVNNIEAEVQSLRCLGYCTPEFATALPKDLAEKMQPLRLGDRGTVFCFRIRPDRREEVRRKISGQAHELYELCPLFLPNVRTVQLAQNTMEMKSTRHNLANDLAGKVKAVKVELTTRTRDQDASTSRFWRLEGTNPGDVWQAALHADSDHRLRVEREADERGTTLKDGAAYAFFPLNAVSWPFRLHLHLKLPTNLARDNWNQDERDQIEEQIKRAVVGMASWLEVHGDKWHPNWHVASLVIRQPNQNETWAWRFWQDFQAELKTKKLLRTINGQPVNSLDARTVQLMARDAALENWSQFCSLVPVIAGDFSIVNAATVSDFGLSKLPHDRLRNFFLAAAKQVSQDSDRRALVMALFTLEDAEPETLERVADNIEVPCSDGTSVTLARLMKRPGGADLPDAWHSLFNTLRNWLWEIPHGLTSVFEGQLRIQIKKLAAREFSPRWEAMPVALGNDAAWDQHGSTFWTQAREACPAGCRKTVIQSLRVKDGTNKWKPISTVWLIDSSPVNCFHDVVALWDRGGALNNNVQNLVREKLRTWGLLDDWEDAIEERLSQNLSKIIHARLTRHLSAKLTGAVLQQPFEAILQDAHQASRDRLPIRWKAIVQEAESDAVRRFLRDRRLEFAAATVLAPNIDNDLSDFLATTGLYQKAPKWLTAFARETIREADDGNFAWLSILENTDFTESLQRELTEKCLREFHRWSGQNFSDAALKAFNRLCEVTPATLRGNWSIGITSRTSELVRNLLNPIPPAGAAAGTDAPLRNDASLNRALLKLEGVRWSNTEQLPELLRKVPAVAAASLDICRLQIEITLGSSPLPAVQSDVAAETRNDPLFRALFQQCDERLASCNAPISVRWLSGQSTVAELRAANFVVLEGQLVTNQVKRVLDEQQFTEVLALYARSARGGREFEQFQQEWNSTEKISHAALYAKYRKSVVPTLVKIQVTDLGYREHHVIRELLQNAENAYDSKPGELPAVCNFGFTLRRPVSSGAWEAIAAHTGRYFNEPVWDRRLKVSEERDDIRLIVSTPSSERAPTEGWVGRFNRGFKSVFTVAEQVEVISGPHRFTIQDMLILNRSQPDSGAGEISKETRFTFRCTKTSALKLLDLKSVEGQQKPLTIFDPSSFVFLQRVNHIRLQADVWTWEWQVALKNYADEWAQVDISQKFPPRKDRFLVRRSETSGSLPRRFAVALKVDSNSPAVLPTKLDEGWHYVRLTFATEDPFPLDILVNGDFETDSGRLGIRNNATNEFVLASCLKLVRQLCVSEVEKSCNQQHWLAWADVLHLAKGEDELKQRFEHHNELVSEWEEAAEFLCQRVPHEGEPTSVDDLIFPTSLVRRLEAFVKLWGFPVGSWIEKEIEDRLPRKVREQCPKQSLDRLVGQLTRNAIETIQPQFRNLEFLQATEKLSGPEKDELERAIRLIERSLTPLTIIPPVIVPIENWSVARLWREWEEAKQPLDEYILEGDYNWPLFFEAPEADPIKRKEHIKKNLHAANSTDGKKLWYRLFSLACLMAAGRRMTEVRSFWQTELDGCDFWKITSDSGFGQATDGLFKEVTTRPFANLAGSGENAYFWRRVFYDIRKIHRLVWDDDFPATLMELLNDGRGNQLLNFLRTGFLPGQNPWMGVFGQSAGAPLFFIVRELCRLGVIDDPAVRPLAFFVCSPVRRAAEKIGWLKLGSSEIYEFNALAAMSEQLYKRIISELQQEPKICEAMLEIYDIPLLHLGLNGNL
jgi:hypothetical protein